MLGSRRGATCFMISPSFQETFQECRTIIHRTSAPSSTCVSFLPLCPLRPFGTLFSPSATAGRDRALVERLLHAYELPIPAPDREAIGDLATFLGINLKHVTGTPDRGQPVGESLKLANRFKSKTGQRAEVKNWPTGCIGRD